MKELVINQIVIPLLVAIIGTILEVSRRQLKAFLDAHKELIEKEKEALENSIGIEKYNKDVATIKIAVQAVEQLGKEFNWDGEIKHNKVLKLIEGKTGLTDEEIYNMIKAAVSEINNVKKII